MPFLFQLKSAWAGYYDYNIWDQNLIIGPHPVITNFLLANGMSGHGLQQSVCVGNAISEILLQGETSAVDLSRFTFDRIIRREKILEDFIVWQGLLQWTLDRESVKVLDRLPCD